MARFAALRPHRRLALPFVLLFGPLFWFVAREVDATADLALPEAFTQFVGQTVLAVVVSYLGAALVVAFVLPRLPSNSRAVGALFEPSNATLAVFAALVVAGAGYIVASTFLAIPGWFDLLAAPVGLLVGFPLVALYGGFVALANAVPTLQHGVAPFVVVGVGVACSVLWTYLLASILARKLGS